MTLNMRISKIIFYFVFKVPFSGAQCFILVLWHDIDQGRLMGPYWVPENGARLALF